MQAKATQVTHLAECRRRYGSNATTKRVCGAVVSVEWLYLPGKTHESCLITADYELGGDVLKGAKLNIRSAGVGEVTVADPSTIPTGTQLVIQNIAVETDAIPVANAQHDPPSDHQAFDDSRDSNTSLLRETIRPRQRDPSAAAVQALAE